MKKEQWDKIVGNRLEETLAKIEQGWKEAGHKDKTAALRWWKAYEEAQMWLEETARHFAQQLCEGGIGPIPDTWEDLVSAVSDETAEDEEILDETIERLVEFYNR